MSFLIFFNQNHASKIRHSITFDIGENVTISYNGSNITNGQVIKVDDKSKFEAQISVPDKYRPSVTGASISGNTIIIDQVIHDSVIKATAVAPCNISISTDEFTHVVDSNNNTIVDEGSTATIKIPYGDPFNANIIRRENYESNDQYGSSISIQSVTQDYNFELKSKIKTCKISIDVGSNMSITNTDGTLMRTDFSFNVPYGNSVNLLISYDDGYEYDSFTKTGNNISVSSSSINISSVIGDCFIGVTSKAKPILYSIRVSPQQHCSVTYDNETITYPTVKTWIINEGYEFSAKVDFDPGWEYQSIFGAEYENGFIKINSVNSNADIVISAQEIYVEPETYNITYNINSPVDVMGDMPKYFNSGDVKTITMYVPIGYEISSITNDAGLTFTELKDYNQTGLSTGKVNYVAFTGELNIEKDVIINLTVVASKFNITYNLIQNPSCLNWATLDSNPTSYEYGTESITFTGNTFPHYKVNESLSEVSSGYAKLSWNQEIVKNKVDSVEDSDFYVVSYKFTGTLTPISSHNKLLGDIVVNIYDYGVKYELNYNVVNESSNSEPGAVASTDTQYYKNQTSGKTEKAFSCESGTQAATAVTIFVHRDYEIDESKTSATSEYLDVSPDLQFYTWLYDYDQTNQPIYNGSWHDAAIDNYSAIYSFSNKRIDNVNYTITVKKKPFYNITNTGENYNIKLIGKRPSGEIEEFDITNDNRLSILRKYTDNQFPTNDGVYTIKLTPLNDYSFTDEPKITCGGTTYSGSIEDGTTNYVVTDIKATGDMYITANAEISVAESNVWLNMINKTGNSGESETINMNISLSGDCLIGDNDSLYEQIYVGAHLNDAKIEHGGTIEFENGWTLPPYENAGTYDGSIESHLPENITKSFNRIFINPNISTNTSINDESAKLWYTISVGISIDSGSTWFSSYESDITQVGNGCELNIPEFTISSNEISEKMKVKLFITVYDEQNYNMLKRVDIQYQDEYGNQINSDEFSLSFTPNQWVWTEPYFIQLYWEGYTQPLTIYKQEGSSVEQICSFDTESPANPISIQINSDSNVIIIIKKD